MCQLCPTFTAWAICLSKPGQLCPWEVTRKGNCLWRQKGISQAAQGSDLWEPAADSSFEVSTVGVRKGTMKLLSPSGPPPSCWGQAVCVVMVHVLMRCLELWGWPMFLVQPSLHFLTLSKALYPACYPLDVPKPRLYFVRSKSPVKAHI